MTRSHIVVGLGYGDEGKGSWVDHLVRQTGAQYVVRFNGGAQAMHHVVTPDDRMYRFAQFGSGTLAGSTFTCLSRFMLIEPEALLAEAEQLESLGVQNPLGRMIVSENAPIITPFNRLLNKIQEISRGGSRHGSCGFGIGLTQADVENLGDQALYVRDLIKPELRKKLAWLSIRKVELARELLNEETVELFSQITEVDLDYYVELYRSFYASVRVVTESEFLNILRENDTVFEGAQGVLLDQQYGFFPHCTRSNTTFENALKLLDEAGFDGSITKVGLLRGYGTRHGAGPFVTEDSTLELATCHNQTNAWQGEFRLGWFDSVAARYALDVVGGVNILAITNLDRMRHLEQIKICTGYQGMDDRYLHGGRLLILEPKLQLLAERTAALQLAAPQYMKLQGLNGSLYEKGLNRYLDLLSSALEHPVHAYSDTPKPHKTYRLKG